MKIPKAALWYFLRESYSKETSSTPDLWSKENSHAGHCAVATVIAQDYLGGEIMRARLPEEWAKRLRTQTHYWNQFEEKTGDDFGTLIADFSKAQFPDSFPYADFVRGRVGNLENKPDNRAYILQFPETQKRYKMLCERVQKFIASNPLYSDEKFLLAWETAFSDEATCPKMRFGCLVYSQNGSLITKSPNKLFTNQFGKERLCSLDGSSCVRMGIASRMDATLGDCGHGPIWCIKQVFDNGYGPADLKHLNFYEAGFYLDGSPWWRSDMSYSCTYCQNMFAIFGLDKIYGAINGAWHPLLTKDSLYSSVEYAQGKKKA